MLQYEGGNVKGKVKYLPFLREEHPLLYAASYGFWRRLRNVLTLAIVRHEVDCATSRCCEVYVTALRSLYFFEFRLLKVSELLSAIFYCVFCHRECLRIISWYLLLCGVFLGMARCVTCMILYRL